MHISIATLRYVGLAASAALLAGCFASNPAAAPASPEQQVRERATAYWQARIKSEAPEAYGLLAPAYRALRSEQDFIKQFGSGISAKDVQVAKVTCETPDRCIANIGMTVKPTLPGLNLPEVISYLDEVWVLEQGQWWRFQAP